MEEGSNAENEICSQNRFTARIASRARVKLKDDKGLSSIDAGWWTGETKVVVVVVVCGWYSTTNSGFVEASLLDDAPPMFCWL